jgi:hypothetical protein
MQFAALQMGFEALGFGSVKPDLQSPSIEAVNAALNLFQDPRQPVQSLLGA